MGVNSIRAVGGQMLFDKLHSGVDEKEYEILRCHFWLLMLKDTMVPTKWLRRTKKGQKVNFNLPQTQEEWDTSYQNLKNHIQWVNGQYDLDMSIEKD